MKKEHSPFKRSSRYIKEQKHLYGFVKVAMEMTECKFYFKSLEVSSLWRDKFGAGFLFCS